MPLAKLPTVLVSDKPGYNADVSVSFKPNHPPVGDPKDLHVLIAGSLGFCLSVFARRLGF